MTFFNAPDPAAPGTTSAPAPTGAFGGFGVGNTTTTAPAAPGPSFGVGVGVGGAFGSPAPAPQQSLVEASDYNTRFPGQYIRQKLSPLLANPHALQADSLEGQELMHLLAVDDNNTDSSSIGSLLLNSAPKLDTFVAPNPAVRHQLTQQMQVRFRSDNAGTTTSSHPLNQSMLEHIFSLADDLRISEADAITLFAAASQNPPQASLLTVKTASTATGQQQENMTAAALARQLYFANKTWLLQTVLSLLQSRIAGETSVVLQAADGLLSRGLVKQLIQFVRESTQRIHELRLDFLHLQARVQATTTSSYTTTGTATNDPTTTTAAMMRHLQGTTEQRQMAAECLFFVACHTQLYAHEVADLVDLIKDLTNGSSDNDISGLPILNPLNDVPPPYEVQAAADQWLMHPQLQMQQGRAKDPLAWQRELVARVSQSGQPQLLRCVSCLVVTVMAALDTKTVLMDRTAHAPNSFGVGNALLPPESSSTNALAPIHSRLCKNSASEWKRRDILGLLMASYAMLLRSSPSALASPRSSLPTNDTSAIDVRKSWRECIEAPTEFKSFSFGRLCLLPALQMPVAAEQTYDVSEFWLAVVSEFAAHYLDVLSSSGDRPISRAKWEQDAEEDLYLRKAAQEQARQFQASFFTNPVDQDVVPDAVDLLQRPDCMDDVFAFATSVCALGPEYAMPFWSTTPEQGAGNNGQISTFKLVPSRALRDLREQQSTDPTLAPSYFSFLAALALAKNEDGSLDGARTIHEMFCEDPVGGTEGSISWLGLVEILRWFDNELSPQDDTASSTGTSTRPGDSPTGSTAYYYFGDNTSTTAGQESNTDSSSRSKSRDLGESNTYILLSYLTLISNVAAGCASARSVILSVDIQSPDARKVIGQDAVLKLLFSLSVTALSPDVRGKVFNTLAELINIDGAEGDERQQIVRAASKSWELLEAYQVLPIHLLEQFQSLNQTSVQNISGFSFPPSSTALVGSKPDNSWIPTDPRYSIIYEMEHVESALGVYASTGGFLSLLKSLFRVGGCPASLGSNWRLRTGCTPYIEYVIDLVLPRATGHFPNLSPLPFRTSQDKNSLVALAFEVTETVISSYIVPSQPVLEGMAFPERYEYSLSKATEKLGHAHLARAVVVEPPLQHDQLYHDLDGAPLSPKSRPSANLSYVDSTRRQFPPTNPSSTSWFPGQSVMPDVAPAKSPGLTILVEILSSSGSPLLKSLLSSLTAVDRQSSNCVSSDSFALAYSLYASTPPSFSSAKKASRNSRYHQVALEALLPVPNTPTGKKSVEWKERLVLAILRVLSAVVAREEALASALSAASIRFSLIPTLRFQSSFPIASQLKEFDSQFLQLSQHIMAADTTAAVVNEIINCMLLYNAGAVRSVGIASAATALICYLERELEPQKVFDLLFRRRDGRGYRLAQAFSTQILASAKHQHFDSAVDLLWLLLDRLLEGLRNPSLRGESFVQTILGLPSETAGGLWTPGIPSATRLRGDCFDAILHLLQKNDLSNPSSISACYEIVFRLCSLDGADPVRFRRTLYASERLRNIDFWKSHLRLMLLRALKAQEQEAPDSVEYIHSLAWIVKGIAEELGLLAGVSTESTEAGLHGLLQQQPTKFQTLLDVLFASNVIGDLMSLLPIEMHHSDAPTVVPPAESIRYSKYKLRGSPDVVDGFDLVDVAKLCSHVNATGATSGDMFQAWADHWNKSVSRDCASSHLTNAIYVVLGSASAASRDLAPHLGNNAGPWMAILEVLLGRLRKAGKIQSLDAVFYTTATRNMASAIFMTAHLLHLSARSATPDSVSNACVLIARAIALSGDCLSEGPFSSRRMERTAILASALALLLPNAGPIQDNLGDDASFLNAAVVLSRLSIGKPSRIIPYNPDAYILVSRSCLTLLFSCFSDERAGLDGGEAFCRSVLTETVGHGTSPLIVEGFISCIPVLDADICSLLLAVASCRSGADILIDYGIFEALENGACTYQKEESEVAGRSTLPFQETEIVAPSFFPGHLRLLSILMAAKQNDREITGSVITRVASILSRYIPLIDRLANKFPRDGDVFELVVKCVTELHLSATRAQSIAIHPMTSNGLVIDDRLQTPMVEVAIHIAENPLPLYLLRPLPSVLAQKEHVVGATVVATRTTVEKTWWDGLDLNGMHSEEEMCRLAALGLGMARGGLCGPLAQQVNILFLLRALCRCADALSWIDRASSQGLYAPAYPTSGKQQSIAQFLAKLSDLIEDVLILLLNRVRQLKHDRKNVLDIIAATLNHVGFDQADFGRLQSLYSDENKLDHIRDFAKVLRGEIETVKL